MESVGVNLTLEWEWGAALVLTISATGLAIVYRRPLKRFLDKAAIQVQINLFGIITIDVNRLLALEEQVKGTGVLQPAATRHIDLIQDSEIKGADPLARDAVLASWARLKQIVEDAALAQKIQLSPSAELPEAVQRLVSANALDKGLAQLIIVLHQEGKRTADHPGKKMFKKEAAIYQRMVNHLLDWIMQNIITPKPAPEPPPKPPPRKTRVGGYFPPPGSGRPTAILISTQGPLRGRQFPIDKEIFRIGAGSENDLVIKGDEYVSGKHALLCYENGSLVIADQQSRNGTFLNDNRLKTTSLPLSPGDRIQVGNSTFEMVQAPAR